MRLPVTLALRPSRRLAIVLTVAHAAAGIAIYPLQLPAPLRIVLLALVLVSLFALLRRGLSIHALRLGARGELEAFTKVSAGGTATVLPETLVLPGMIVLALRLEDRRQTLVLLPDNMADGEFRRLRVWLGARARLRPAA
ncbi:MAG: protein YgfX [Pseudomonadota bacterium]